MYYEIINPSDKCFFKADDLKIAGLVTVILGNGQYGAEPEEEGAPNVPLFLFGGFDEWWAQNGDGESEGAVDRNAPEIIAALRTVCYGDLRERALFDEACAAIDDPQKKADFIESWNDKHRSSMNNIMGRAHAIAEKLEQSRA